MSSWDDLSMAEKADVMKLAIEGGVYDLDAIRSGYNEYASGGKIHIKPENRGKFTALKERTGHSATWFKEHGTPSEKRMATFAINAAKWKHGDGGNLYGIGGKVVTTGGAGYIPPAINLPTKQEVRKRLYENLNPYDYGNAITRVAKAVIGNTKEDVLSEGVYMPEVDDLWAEYLQIPQSQRHSGSKLVNEGHHTKVLPAVYKPTKSSGSGKYYRLDLNESSKKAIVDEAMGNTYEEGFDISPNPYNNHLGIKRIEKNPLSVGENRVATSYDKTLNWALRDFTVGRGRDNKGEYVSYYDLWDLSPYRISNKDQSFGIGKPFEIYDRIYLDDYYGVPKESRGGNYLPEIVVTGKRKHGLGGNLYGGTTEDSQQMQLGLKVTNGWKPYTLEDMLKFATINEANKAAQEAAIARGDMAEAQRLRDLHFKVSAPNTKVKEAVFNGSLSDKPFYEFNTNFRDAYWGGRDDYTTGAWFGTGDENTLLSFVGDNPNRLKKFYLNFSNPFIKDAGYRRWDKLLPFNMTEEDITIEAAKLREKGFPEYVIEDWKNGLKTTTDNYALKLETTDYDSGIIKNVYENKAHPDSEYGVITDYIASKPNQIKSADAVTYDDKGVRIPLGLRDNFKINDIRYGLLPFLGLGAAGTLYGTSDR